MDDKRIMNKFKRHSGLKDRPSKMIDQKWSPESTLKTGRNPKSLTSRSN